MSLSATIKNFRCTLHLLSVLLLNAVLIVPAAFAASDETEVIQYVGNAYDLNDGNSLLYREEHRLTLVNGKPSSREVNYFSATNELIVTKKNSYLQNPAAPEFDLHDLRSDYREQANYQSDGSLILAVQESDKTRKQSKQFNTIPDNLIIDAGFDDFVRGHWSELETGKSINFSFASAARLDLIDFRLLKKDSDKDQLVLSMRLKSRLLAWLLDPIELTYDQHTKQLIRYSGLSNIQDSNGNSYSADIRYQYK